MEPINRNICCGDFQMPLHYPRYTKEDYQHMPEWMLDHLLAQYGLSPQGDLGYKREFAMGAFLWPDTNYDHQSKPFSSSICHVFEASSFKAKKVVEFLCQVMHKVASSSILGSYFIKICS
ncbi:hypothetical protein CFOL_v3_13818 [Cephalotus follicularis]|uniref:DUF7722 domain-containing protein n=1 Tax=Cephalotus follicularis TaxID=3775 RepID=A0A1Q3BQP1_CEPFO|nr:hypothetical protein CFOL_v3_13818 [Cephalotus follicularis]